MRSIVCWSWDARSLCASPDPERGWGEYACTPSPCNTPAHLGVDRQHRGKPLEYLSRWLAKSLSAAIVGASSNKSRAVGVTRVTSCRSA